MARRVAVVTGANKGIGFALVKALCRVFEGDVILTARDEERGKSAIKQLEKDGLCAKFHQLDVTDHHSIAHLKQFIQENYSGLDLLVNNAGIAYLFDVIASFPKVVETMNVNYFGVLNVSKALFPLLRPHARVCNMSSRTGIWAYQRCSDSVQTKLRNISITMADLTSMLQDFVQSCQEGQTNENVLPSIAYGMSKLWLTVMTRIQQKELDEQGRDSILVNSCSPGYVNTNMTAGKGPLTVEEGIVTPLYVCLLPLSVDSPRGAMLSKKEVLDWEDPSFDCKDCNI